ncbi:MAG: TonB-dependent receptor [Bacteroidia bacterium]|nr:TonB-dependent receptor [Bacteroidia bacterium]
MKNYLLLFLLGSSFFSHVHAQTQTIRGRIQDQQSQYPLIGASVFIPETDPLIGASTDAEGYFELKNVPLGRVSVKVTYLGYREQFIPNVLVTSGKEVVLNVSLEEQIMNSDEIVITAEKDKTQLNNELATVSARGFTLEETSRYAGSRNDPSRMAANFAGVNGANDSRNDIIIRGNSPAGLLWRFEGVDIPSPNHFGTLGATGGPVGMLNNNVLANSDFFTGAFPAEYGNANAGAFDLKMRTGNNAKREHLLQIGFAGVEAGIEGPFSKDSRASYLVNYRYSTLAVFSALGLNFGTGEAVPQYQDLSFKIDLPTKKAGRFSLFGLGGLSNIDLLGSQEDNPNPEDAFGDINSDLRFESGMGVVGLTHTYFFNESTSSDITLAVSGSYNQGIADSLTRNTSGEVVARTYNGATDFSQTRYSLRGEINKKFNTRNTVRAGIIADLYNIELVDSALQIQTQTFEVRQNFSGSSTLWQAYAQWQHRFNDKLTLNTGLHYQQFGLNNSIAVEPRVGLKYSFMSSQSLSFGFGMHSQLQPLQVYFRDSEVAPGIKMRTNENLDFTRSIHYVLGYDNALSSNLRLKIEAYYQRVYDAPVERNASSFSLLNAGADFQIPPTDSLLSEGTGYNYGLEFTLEKFYSRNYYFLLTASLFESKYEGSDKIERNTAFNGNYILNFLFGKEFEVKSKNVFFMDTKVTLAGGRRFTPIDLDASRSQGFEVLQEENAFEEQLDDYFRWDVKAGYRINARRMTHEFFVDVQNVTNNQNVLTRQYNRTTQDVRDVYQLGLFPVIQYKLQF